MGLSKAFLNRGGFSEVVWKGGDESRISFQLVTEIGATDSQPTRIYEYEISIVGSATGSISVEGERLEVKAGNQVSRLIDLGNGQGQIIHLDGSIAFSQPGPGHSALEFTVPGWEGTSLKYHIMRWQFYHLLPPLMRQANPAIGQTFLSESGVNFSSWLMTLQTSYPNEFRMLRQAALDVFPDLEEILTPPTQQATTNVTTHEKHLKRPVGL